MRISRVIAFFASFPVGVNRESRFFKQGIQMTVPTIPVDKAVQFSHYCAFDVSVTRDRNKRSERDLDSSGD